MLTSPSPNWSNSISFADVAELDCKVPYDVNSISKMPMPGASKEASRSFGHDDS
jgi:hypothetical protein